MNLEWPLFGVLISCIFSFNLYSFQSSQLRNNQYRNDSPEIPMLPVRYILLRGFNALGKHVFTQNYFSAIILMNKKS